MANDYNVIVTPIEVEEKAWNWKCVTDRGCIFSNGTRSDGDLFMAPVKHEGWVNVYTPSSEGKYIVSAVAYDTEADAKKAGLNKSESYVATVKIEWEE